MPGDLATCTHVFIRQDSVRTPLQQPYTGPFKVLKRTNKHFTIDLKHCHNTVSVDRLKPAYIEVPHEAGDFSLPQMAVTEQKQSQLPAVTRSGRRVHWPDRLNL